MPRGLIRREIGDHAKEGLLLLYLIISFNIMRK